MKIKIILRNKRLILINEDDSNRAFASFGVKDMEYEYLYKQFLKNK